MGSQQAKSKQIKGKSFHSMYCKNQCQTSRKDPQVGFSLAQMDDLPMRQSKTTVKQSKPIQAKVSDQNTEESENFANVKRQISYDGSACSLSFSNTSSKSNSHKKDQNEYQRQMDQLEQDFQLVIQEQNKKSYKKKSLGILKKKKTYMEIMMDRWKKQISTIPQQDQIDVIRSFLDVKEQNSPEYSQEVYENMLIQEDDQHLQWLEKHLSEKNQLHSSEEKRKLRDEFAERIIYLCQQKNYKLETMHLALNIYDRVITSSFIQTRIGLCRQIMPLIIITSVLLAAKVEQPLSPSIKMTVRLFPEDEQPLLTKQRIVDLERHCLFILDFDMQVLSPLTFLERFLRLTQVDKNSTPEVQTLAKEILLLAKCKYQFLNYKPSQLAACALILAQNAIKDWDKQQLQIWNQDLEELTKIKKDLIKPVYQQLLQVYAMKQQNPELPFLRSYQK